MFTLSNAFFPYIGGPGLSVSIDAGFLFNNGGSTLIPAQTISLPANSTTYIFMNLTAVQVQSNNSGFPASGSIPIAIVTTNNSGPVQITDMRPDFGGAGSGGASISRWDQLQSAQASLTLNNAGFSTTFNQTSAVPWTWANTTAATSTTPQNSPILNVVGTYWNWANSDSETDTWSIQDTLTPGAQNSFTQSSESATDVVITAPGHTFIKGQFVTFSGLTNLPWLNGLTLPLVDVTFGTDDLHFIDPTNHGTIASAPETGFGVTYPISQLTISQSGSNSGLSQVWVPAELVGVQPNTLSAAAQNFLFTGSSTQSTFRIFTNNPTEDGGALLLFNDVQTIKGHNISGLISNLMLTPTENISLNDGQAFGMAIGCWHEGNFNYSSMIGVQIQVGSDPVGDIGGTGTIAEMITLDVTPPFGPVSGGGVTTSTSIRTDDANAPSLGTIGTSYVIHMNSQTSGGVGHWAIFQVDATDVNQMGTSWYLGVLGFTGTTSTAADTGFSRLSAAVVALGNGTAGDFSGTLKTTVVNAVTGFQINGTAPLNHFLVGNGTDYVDSATIPTGTVLWNQIGNASGALTLSNAGNATTFNQTSAVNWTWANTTAATSGTSQSSPIHTFAGQYWTGAASATDSWTIQNVVGNGTNGTSTLTFTHSGTSGAALVSAAQFKSTAIGTATSFNFGDGSANGLSFDGSSIISLSSNSNAILALISTPSNRFVTTRSDAVFGWSSTTTPISTITPDTGLSRISAGVVGIGTGAQGSIAGNLQLAKITSYNGVSTVAAGVPPEYATIDLTGQNGSIGTTTLFATGTTPGAGMYRISYYLDVSTAGVGGTVTATFGWSDGDSSETITSASVSLGGITGDFAQGVITFYSAASQNITYSTTFTIGTGSPIYKLRARLEYLG